VSSSVRRIRDALGSVKRRLGGGEPAFFTRDALREQVKGHDVHIGEWTYGHPRLYGLGESTLVIGRYCSIALEVDIFLGYEHNTRWISTYPFPDPLLLGHFPEGADVVGHPRSKGPVVIGNDVWIGHGATILSGVNIGDGAVIGAGSVVTSDVAPYTVAIGAPAKPVRRRFDDETVARLLRLRWWDWPSPDVREIVPLLCSPDLAGLDELEARAVRRGRARPGESAPLT
jgi:acetyltransferase-like isoleucine patch superfamily enzyme